MAAKLTGLRRYIFFRDVFLLSLTAFGGPQAHFLQFKKILIDKRKYLTWDELSEINSFCQMLPGPTSTQTLLTIAYRMGGASFAIFSLFIWAMPSSFFMTLLALMIWMGGKINGLMEALTFMPALASAFMAHAAILFTRQMVHSNLQKIILVLAAGFYLWITHPVMIPFVLLLGGSLASRFSGEVTVIEGPRPTVKWSNLALFAAIFLLAVILGNVFQIKPMLLFENTYRYGSLVFGGGNVLIPMFFDQFVLFKSYLDASQFMTGVGMIQAMPGPVFSFASYACGFAMQDWGTAGIALGGLIGMFAIFTPGLLITFFLHPIWFRIRRKALIQNAVHGINAASAGLVISAAWLIFTQLPDSKENYLAMGCALFLLFLSKIPAPILVIITLLAGGAFHYL